MRRILAAAVVLATLVAAPAARAWTWPLDGPILRPFSLGADVYAGDQHRGVDIGGAVGTSVRAPASGTVSFVGSVPDGGRAVTIQTSDGYAVTLLQLGSVEVLRGDVVEEGATVGSVGESADATTTQPHVHLGIRRAEEPEGYVDPLGLLSDRGAASVPAPIPVVPRTSDPRRRCHRARAAARRRAARSRAGGRTRTCRPERAGRGARNGGTGGGGSRKARSAAARQADGRRSCSPGWNPSFRRRAAPRSVEQPQPVATRLDRFRPCLVAEYFDPVAPGRCRGRTRPGCLAGRARTPACAAQPGRVPAESGSAEGCFRASEVGSRRRRASRGRAPRCVRRCRGAFRTRPSPARAAARARVRRGRRAPGLPTTCTYHFQG